ncbi:Glutamyl-tRNA(Gln) amidotransferase subunit A [Candidatus Johnevansia muelleri]|uniref:Glutamyl-tRNA(Gln) amidotransferase subunit A n=1 Tax=Candidatus Johnevansia muelleri TaxID=1495769 RepID=A0A078KEI2_9GAMM|nr:Glutamyl-tRNA(Gln) amidotransferase subunit A [Candidatus Evansia muelleri]
MLNLTIKEIINGLNYGEFLSIDLIYYLLTRINLIDPEINSFITVTAEQAITDAHIADKIRKKGKANLLTGVPIAYKDTFCIEGVRTTCASKMLLNFKAPYTATVVNKLKKAGIICLGKTNMDEFSMGSSNESSYFGPVKNPCNLNLIPGGSSGGSAAAVAAGLVPAALGTDTGGSIRQPAAFCGITGIKPTYGRISRYGMIAYASSFDQCGPMAKTVEDCAILLNIMAGHDKYDSTSARSFVPNYIKNINNSIKGLKIGLPIEYFNKYLDKNMELVIREAINVYKSLGVNIIEVSLPYTQFSLPSYYVIAFAEAASNLARYDGVRFGYRSNKNVNFEDMYKITRSEGFGEEVKRRILIGTYMLSNKCYDIYYRKAQKIRRLIYEDFLNIFKKVQILICPTTNTQNSKMYLDDIYTISANLAGVPSINIPAGFINNNTVGLQLMAPHFHESLLLNIAHLFQKNTNWHKYYPKLKFIREKI